MTAGSASWSQPASRRRFAVAGFAAAAVFLASWGLLHVGFWTRGQIRDTLLYQQYGNLVADGHVPYRDPLLKLEYPPGAIPAFWLPTIGHARSDVRFYEGEFEALMAVCGVGCMLAMTSILRSLGAGRRRLALALGFAGLAPLALGSVMVSRFDLWPTLLVLVAGALILRGRLRLGHAALGLAFVTKLFPAVLLPLTLAYAWRTRGRREALLSLAAFAAVSIAVVAPFAALSPDGVWQSARKQLERPLQIESLGSSILLALHQAAGLHLRWYSSHGSQNIHGRLADAIGAASTAVAAAVLVALWISFARGPATGERLVRHAAAALVAFVAFGKVLSPQFMIWLLPVVPLVRGRRGAWASLLLAATFVLTQLWFPGRYWRLLFSPVGVPCRVPPAPLTSRCGFDALVSWLVFARDVLLVALLVVLTAPAPGRARSRSPGRPPHS